MFWYVVKLASGAAISSASFVIGLIGAITGENTTDIATGLTLIGVAGASTATLVYRLWRDNRISDHYESLIDDLQNERDQWREVAMKKIGGNDEQAE